jgi:hypothetical protein
MTIATTTDPQHARPKTGHDSPKTQAVERPADEADDVEVQVHASDLIDARERPRESAKPENGSSHAYLRGVERSYPLQRARSLARGLHLQRSVRRGPPSKQGFW